MTAPSSSSVFWAEWRRGLKDLQNAVINPFNGIAQTHEEPGTIGNPTPQMVTQNIQGKGVSSAAPKPPGDGAKNPQAADTQQPSETAQAPEGPGAVENPAAQAPTQDIQGKPEADQAKENFSDVMDRYAGHAPAAPERQHERG